MNPKNSFHIHVCFLRNDTQKKNFFSGRNTMEGEGRGEGYSERSGMNYKKKNDFRVFPLGDLQ